jgi:hypothetical protein
LLLALALAFWLRPRVADAQPAGQSAENSLNIFRIIAFCYFTKFRVFHSDELQERPREMISQESHAATLYWATHCFLHTLHAFVARFSVLLATTTKKYSKILIAHETFFQCLS